jgi:hypothetical protein
MQRSPHRPMSSISGPTRPLILVLHGPEIFDSGEIHGLLEQLSPGRVIVAGVMARTAAEESGICCEYIGVPPSMVIRELRGIVILANQGKTPESGYIFGEIVASRLYPEPLIQLEVSSRTLYVWNKAVDDRIRDISKLTGYVIEPAAVGKRDGGVVRTIRGCLPGEAVYVNGIVIGIANRSEVVVRSESGRIIAVSGLRVKDHGLEKLQKTDFSDLSQVWCKSGNIRTTGPGLTSRRSDTGNILFVDHCGHELYRKLTPATCGIVSIGDDTTAVCGHIASHLGIPVFGIVDGDGDHIVQGSFVEGSVIARAVHERDDDIGNEIRAMVPEVTVSWDMFTRQLAEYLSERVVLTRPGAGGSSDEPIEQP